MPLRALFRVLVAFSLCTAGFYAAADVQPSSGPIYGGTAITITGNNFDSSSDVYVDGNQATGIVVVNSTTITAVTPEGFIEGAVDVDVQTTNDAFSFPGAFTYVAPTITSVNPAQGSIIGGTNVTLSGTLFADGMQLSFDGNPASNIAVVDSNTMTATTPAGFVEGPVSVDIDYLSTFASLANGFTYLQPRIDAITPSSGSVDGGTPVTITGAYFASDVSIDFDGTSAAGVTFVDSNTVTAVTPPGISGQVSVDLNIGGGTGYASTTFTYIDPAIASVVPNSGPESGGTAVTISGTLFDPSATVEFDGISATSVTVVDSNTITATTPAGAGVVDVTVTTVNSQAVLGLGFTYIATPPPQVSGVTPQSGDSNGGLPITITGTDFQNGASARLGGTPINNLT
ncbi:MAG: IPT/TIG domain-containing protein, partial [Thiogranum sp.]